MCSKPAGFKLLVTGRVQNVGYRYYCLRAADALGLKGWVRNLPDGSVEMEVFGGETALNEFIEDVAGDKAGFKINGVVKEAAEHNPETEGFIIK
ncbi:MAG TPA: acylphosphatase [bacterium]|nr:acylphosphatase [bacterium]